MSNNIEKNREGGFGWVAMIHSLTKTKSGLMTILLIVLLVLGYIVYGIVDKKIIQITLQNQTIEKKIDLLLPEDVAIDKFGNVIEGVNRVDNKIDFINGQKEALSQANLKNLLEEIENLKNSYIRTLNDLKAATIETGNFSYSLAMAIKDQKAKEEYQKMALAFQTMVAKRLIIEDLNLNFAEIIARNRR